MDKMKILLLGSTGAVGTAFEYACRDRNIECISYTHDDIDVTDRVQLLETVVREDPYVVINCTGLVGINQCAESPSSAMKININTPKYLSRICKDLDVILVHFSTHTVFDGFNKIYYTEFVNPNPQNTYGATKLFGEEFVSNTCNKYYIFRFPTLFGPRQNDKIGFVDKVIEWIKEGRDLRIADDKLDSPTYTIDAANTILNIIENKGEYGLYHIANDGGISLYEFVEELLKIMNADNKLERAKDSDFKSLEPKAVNTMMRSDKIPPMRNWKEALKEYVDTYVK